MIGARSLLALLVVLPCSLVTLEGAFPGPGALSRARSFPSAVSSAVSDGASHVVSAFPGVRAANNFGKFYCRGEGGPPPSKLCSGLVQKLGFGCKDYVTRTQDGFTLGLQRISKHADVADVSKHSPNPDNVSKQGKRRGSWGAGAPEEELVRTSQGQGGARNLLTSANGPGAATSYMDATSAGGGAPDAVPVLVQHGLLVAAESWLLNDPPLTSLPFQLTSAGFDTWLGNTRCSPWTADEEADRDTHWSGVRRVKNLFPQPFNRKADWDWSWDEMARYDLPAQIGKILNVTSSPFVLYVGHSQGTLTLLSSLAMGWVPREHIKGAYLLSPISYLKNMKAEIVRRGAEINFDKMVQDTGLHHFSFHNEIGQRVLGQLCAQEDINCTSLVTAITGPNCCVDLKRAETLFPWFPLSTSVKNMAHFAQSVRTGLWRMFDHGWRNILVYGTLEPPTYDPSKIPEIPMTLAYGDRDTLGVVQDVFDLVSELEFKPRMFELPTFAHLDFILGSTWEYNNVLYEDVVGFLNATVHGRDP